MYVHQSFKSFAASEEAQEMIAQWVHRQRKNAIEDKQQQQQQLLFRVPTTYVLVEKDFDF